MAFISDARVAGFATSPGSAWQPCRCLSFRRITVPRLLRFVDIGMLPDLRYECGGGLRKMLARFQQCPADEQHDARAIEIKHLRHPGGAHAAGRHGHAGTQALVLQSLARDSATSRRGKSEPSAVIRENGGVGAEEAEQLAEKKLRSNAPDARHAGMGDESHCWIVPDETMKLGAADDHWSRHNRIDSHRRRERNLPAQR